MADIIATVTVGVWQAVMRYSAENNPILGVGGTHTTKMGTRFDQYDPLNLGVIQQTTERSERPCKKISTRKIKMT